MELEAGIRDKLNDRFQSSMKYSVKLELRPGKYDNRILVLTEYYLYLMFTKATAKPELKVHYLDLCEVVSQKTNQLTILTNDGKQYTLCFDSVDESLQELLRLLANAFPTVSICRLISRVVVTPDQRFQSLLSTVLQPHPTSIPCGGYSRMYAAMCEYHNLPLMEDVTWDIDTTYDAKDIQVLPFNDFDHLDQRNLIPIISALRYNSWFTKVNAANTRLIPDCIVELLTVMKTNQAIQELDLTATGLTRDFCHKFSSALTDNTESALTGLTLSYNQIEDKGIQYLCTPLSSLDHGFSELHLCHCGITQKGVNTLARALINNRQVLKKLTTLNLSDNVLKLDESSNLYEFLGKAESIRVLNLSATESGLDTFFDSVSGAGLLGSSLEHLDISQNVFTTKRSRSGVSPGWKMFFSEANSIKHLNLSACRLPSEALKMVLLGLNSNDRLADIEVNLSSNELRSHGAYVIELCVGYLRNIATLDISNNGFDTDLIGICNHVPKSFSLRKLLIGRNFTGVKAKSLPKVMDSIAQMLQEETSPLESLSIADSRLKLSTTHIINALGTNTTLKELDISGNQMGDTGARMLAKALQLNSKLTTIYWDRNGTTAQGLTDVALALERNRTLHIMPTPVNDIAVALRLNGEKTENALQQIDKLLQRNHSRQKLSADQAYRLHQGCFMSSTQKLLERLTKQIERHICTLEAGKMNDEIRTSISTARKYVYDANHATQIMPTLQEISKRSEAQDENITEQLDDITARLQQIINEQIQNNLSEMITSSTKHCPAILSDETFLAKIKSSSLEKALVPPDFTKELMAHVSTDVINKLCEVNLVMSSKMCDSSIDILLQELERSEKQLMNHVNKQSSGQLPSPDRATSDDLDTPIPVVPEEPPKEADYTTLKKYRRLRPQSVIDPAEVRKALALTRGNTASLNTPIPAPPMGAGGAVDEHFYDNVTSSNGSLNSVGSMATTREGSIDSGVTINTQASTVGSYRHSHESSLEGSLEGSLDDLDNLSDEAVNDRSDVDDGAEHYEDRLAKYKASDDLDDKPREANDSAAAGNKFNTQLSPIPGSPRSPFSVPNSPNPLGGGSGSAANPTSPAPSLGVPASPSPLAALSPSPTQPVDLDVVKETPLLNNLGKGRPKRPKTHIAKGAAGKDSKSIFEDSTEPKAKTPEESLAEALAKGPRKPMGGSTTKVPLMPAGSVIGSLKRTDMGSKRDTTPGNSGEKATLDDKPDKKPVPSSRGAPSFLQSLKDKHKNAEESRSKDKEPAVLRKAATGGTDAVEKPRPAPRASVAPPRLTPRLGSSINTAKTRSSVTNSTTSSVAKSPTLPVPGESSTDSPLAENSSEQQTGPQRKSMAPLPPTTPATGAAAAAAASIRNSKPPVVAPKPRPSTKSPALQQRQTVGGDGASRTSTTEQSPAPTTATSNTGKPSGILRNSKDATTNKSSNTSSTKVHNTPSTSSRSSEAVGESLSSSSSGGGGSDDGEEGKRRRAVARRRSSVKDKIAALELDRNSNETTPAQAYINNKANNKANNKEGSVRSRKSIEKEDGKSETTEAAKKEFEVFL